MGVASVWSSTLLFLFRVNGVFYGSSRAKVFFTSMWLFAVFSALVFPSHYTAAAPTPPHALCAIASAKRFAFLSLVPIAIFDWVVFGAISIRVIMVFAPQNHWRGMCRAFITGADIGVVPRALLRTGQSYFLWVLASFPYVWFLTHTATHSPMLCVHACVLWLETSPDIEHSIPYQYQGVAIMAGLIVMNSLACRVFRLLRQLKTHDGQFTPPRDVVSTLHFPQNTQRAHANWCKWKHNMDIQTARVPIEFSIANISV